MSVPYSYCSITAALPSVQRVWIVFIPESVSQASASLSPTSSSASSGDAPGYMAEITITGIDIFGISLSVMLVREVTKNTARANMVTITETGLSSTPFIIVFILLLRLLQRFLPPSSQPTDPQGSQEAHHLLSFPTR